MTLENMISSIQVISDDSKRYCYKGKGERYNVNLYQFAASTNNKRINNLNMSERSVKKFFSRFDMLRLDIFDIKAMQKSFIFAALYQKRGGLHNWRKVHPIEYIAVVDKPKYSLFDVLKNKIKT
jgi:hypothetical protein